MHSKERRPYDAGRPHGGLGLYELELDANLRAQQGKVGLPGESLGEAERLMRPPRGAQLDLLEFIEVESHRMTLLCSDIRSFA